MAPRTRSAGTAIRRLAPSPSSHRASIPIASRSSSSSSSSSRPCPHAARLPATPQPPCSSRRHSTSSPSSPSSVNPDEVSHFTALAADWWNPHGSSRLLHLMNPMRHDFIQSCRRSTSPGARATDPLTYLDIGCGGGIFAESAARLPSSAGVLAIDPTPEVLAVARAHARRDPALRGKLTYRLSSVEQLPVPATGYDVVSLWEVIEHVNDPPRFLDRVRAFVRPGGWLVMSTVARTWTSWLTTNVVAEDVLGIVPRGTHDWHKYVNEEELRRCFVDKEGWVSPRVMGVVYVPGVGWREVAGSEKIGNYFFAIQRAPLTESRGS